MTGVQLREHTLNRLTYGPSPTDRDRYDLLGHDEFIKQQLGTGATTLAPVSGWGSSMHELGVDAPTRIKAGVARMLYRATTEESQLVLVLSDLFYNHLNVFAAMGVGSHTFEEYLDDQIVGNVLGRFSTMLYGTGTHSAMLHYLDNKRNKVGANNENYAREVMELHTLGIGDPDDPNFTEADVKIATRILTGWSITGEKPDYGSAFNSADHDFDPGKKIFKVDYSAFTDGQAEIEHFLGELARHPQTSARIVGKLYRRFFGDQAPPADLLHIARKTYSHSDTSILAVLEYLLFDDAFADETLFRARIKPPHRFVVSAYRMLGMTPLETDLEKHVGELLAVGDQPYFYGPPTGYPDDSSYWLTANGMLSRFQLAETIATEAGVSAVAKSVAGIGDKDALPQVIEKLAHHIFGGGDTPGPGATGVPSIPTLPSWLIANDSAKTAYYYAKKATTQDEQIKRALTMLLSTPEFLRY